MWRLQSISNTVMSWNKCINHYSVFCGSYVRCPSVFIVNVRIDVHCATSRRVAVSFPDGVFGTFYRIYLPGLNMAVESTQPVIDTSTRNILWE